MYSQNRPGITIIHVIIAVAAILVVIGGATYVLSSRSRMRDVPRDGQQNNRQSADAMSHPGPGEQSIDQGQNLGSPTAQNSSAQQTQQSSASTGSSSANQLTSNNTVTWQLSNDGWKPTGGTPPECPNPLAMKSPVDMSLVSGILYPGQTRGGNYKPHGGFRFDSIKDNQVTVVAPLDGSLVRGSQYLVDGEIQYTFDVINSCGIMFRVGHFLTLPAKYQTIADTFPAAQEGDSRTHDVNPPVSVKAGEVMATAVGIRKGSNTFFDLGIMDFRNKNEASKNASWLSQHDTELAPYAICWFDMLPAPDAAIAKSLPPGDPESGKNSDYCK